MKTLVTGATGFIGSHIVKALHKRKREIKCLVRRGRRTDLIERYGVEIVYGDLLDKDSLCKALENVDTVYHLAGEVYSTQAKRYFEVNLTGLSNLLAACLERQLKRFIHFSSSSVVGPNPDKTKPVNEESPCKPITPYGKSKLEGECLIKDFFERHGIPAVIIRPPLVYGPNVSRSSRVLMFLNLINSGLFRVVGSGENLISLCYIENLIHGVLKSELNENACGEIFFISDERPYSINEIAEVLSCELGKELPRYHHIPIWFAEILSLGLLLPSKLFGFTSPLSRNRIQELKNCWYVDISKAKKILGYEQLVTFREGVKATVDWYRNEYLS